MSAVTEIVCSEKNSKQVGCKNDASDGLEIDGKHLCRYHYGMHMTTLKLIELGKIVKKSEEEPPVIRISCKGKTKDDKPCGKTAAKDCDGFCKVHHKIAVKSVPETPEKKDQIKCCSKTAKGEDCPFYALEDSEDGLCKRHHNSKLKKEKKTESDGDLKDPSESSSPSKKGKDLNVDELIEASNRAMEKRTVIKASSDSEEESETRPLLDHSKAFANVQLPDDF